MNEREERLKNSVNVVKRIIQRVANEYRDKITNYGLKDNNPEYEFWVEYNGDIHALHKFGRGDIEDCTDPNRGHAIDTCNNIERYVRQILAALK